MKKVKLLVLVLLVAIGFSSCDILLQMAQMANFANCTFDFNNVNEVQVLDMPLSRGMSKSDLNVLQLLQVAAALKNKSLPVTFNVNLNVTNPNSVAAAMSKMDYIVTLNDKQVISTTMNNSINVPANGSNVISIPITTDLFQLFSGDTGDAILNLAFKLAGASSDPVNVGIKVKPYITVGDQQLAYPDYISMSKVLQ